MLQFDPETGLSAPSTAEIRQQVQEDWQAAFQQSGVPPLNVEPETPAGQLIDSETAIIADKNAEVLYLANMFNPRTAQGIWQAALGQIYFITPKQAQASVAECTCTGLAGTLIPAGSLIQSTVDQTQWAALSDTTIPTGGQVSVQFACQTEGPVTAGAETLTQIVTVTPGWDTVSNPAAAVTGYDAETQQAFEARRYASVAANARGSVAAIYGALSQLDGVIDLAVLENTGADPQTIQGVEVPGHSIWVTIVGGTDADIAQTIYEKKDAGCGTGGNTQVSYTDTTVPGNPSYTYNINRPESLAFGFKVTLQQTDTTPENITQLVQNAILAEFNGENTNPRVGTAQTVYASRFFCGVVSAEAANLISIQICAPASGEAWGESVTVTADQEPVLSSDDIQVIVQEAG